MLTRRISSGLLVAVLVVTTLLPGASVTIDSPASDQVTTAALARLERSFGQLPLYFVENQGQLDERVAYYVQGSDKMIYFTPEGVTFALTAPVTQTAAIPKDQMASLHPMGRSVDESPVQSQRWTVKLDFVDANPDVRPVGQEEAEAVISYFKGQPDQWHAGLPTYARIVYADLWPGIDLVYYGTVDRLKYEFVVHPGADPSQIQLAYRGATDVMLNDAGQMEVSTPVGGFTDDVPVAYQEIDGRRVAVDAVYDLHAETPDLLPEEKGKGTESKRAYSFALGDYDPSHSLIIDPAVLVYCGYIGALDEDWGLGIAVDDAGYAYITGFTLYTAGTFPVKVGPDLTYNGELDAFIAKVTPGGNELVYCGYIGGGDDEWGRGVAVDDTGHAYIVGETESSEGDAFPVTVGPDLTFNDFADAFVAKVKPDGTGLDYCGYIGGLGTEWGEGIAVDDTGNAYITGRTTSAESDAFPVAVGPDLTYNGGYDAFVAKVRADGTGLDYCGYIGGSAKDFGHGIAVDDSGNAYVTGLTTSTESDAFPVTAGPDLTHNGGDDAFVAKVEADGTGLVYAGYIGGSGAEFGDAIAVDDEGSAYITGPTESTESTFPVAVGPDLTYNGGSRDTFVAKVAADGSGLDYCGYIGGSGGDYGYGIAIDAGNNAYVTGLTWSTESTFPVAVGPDLTYNGNADAFVARVNVDGSGLAYCGYIGGSGYEWSEAIAVDAIGSVYITGQVGSDEATFPVTVGPALIYNGGYDAFVAKVRGEPGVIVVDENGDPLEGAKVYRNGVFSDTTWADGFLAIPDLQAGDTLAATWLVTEVATNKGHHDQDSTQNWAYRVYLTSVPIDNLGNPGLHTVTDLNATQVLTAAQSNTLIGFNIVVSVEWDASAAYLNDLHQGFQNASDYLYDATDGQMFFERVTIYDDKEHWGDADYQFRVTNQLGANAWLNGLKGNGPWQQAHFQRAPSGGGTWASRGFHTYIHEFGHYGLGLYDSYFYYKGLVKKDGRCTSIAVYTNGTPDINATLMYWQHTTTEFAMQGVAGLWSPQCELTRQWRTGGKSDWEAIVEKYDDEDVPARWQVGTPADRGGVVVPGPGNIPVTEWMTSTVNNTNTGICASDPVVGFTDLSGMPMAEADVWLDKSDHAIYQGRTDSAGEITILGAADGDYVVASHPLLLNQSSIISCTTTPDVPDAAAEPVEVILEEAPFTLDISVVPTSVDYQAQVQVKASTILSGTPQAEVFQLGSSTPISVALAYESSTGLYTGTVDLDPSLAPAGSVAVTAQDATSHTLQVFNNFGLFPVTASEDTVAYSDDGLAELYLPAGSLSSDVYVSFVPDSAAGPPPEGLVILSGPYNVQAGPGVTLNNDVGLSLKYLDTGGTLDGIDPSTAQIYRWDAGTEQWVPLTSSVLEGRNEVSAAIDAFGTYAVMAAEPQHSVYLPIVTYD